MRKMLDIKKEITRYLMFFKTDYLSNLVVILIVNNLLGVLKINRCTAFTDKPCVSSFIFNWAWKSHLQIVKTIPKFHSFCRKLNIFHGCQSESSAISCRVMRQCRQIVLKRATGGQFLTTPIRCPKQTWIIHNILLWIENFP